MNSVLNYSYEQLINMLLGKQVNMVSDCEFFPMFNVTGKIISYQILTNELLFTMKCTNGKVIKIGSNMKNLQFNILH